MAQIDFKTDILKHYVRKYGWLPACQQQFNNVRRKRRLNRNPLRYFTFCASEAIDVFMLEREGILHRSIDTGRLQDVYFCEMEPEDFGIIADLIGSPKQGFLGEFEKIVLFEDDEDTKGRSIEDEEFYPPLVRKKLRYKDAHIRLREAIPFDIINLDVFGIMFPPKQQDVIAPLLKSIIRILEWQTEAKIDNEPLQEFTLLLTSHIDADNANPHAIDQLTNILSNNLTTYTEFHSGFLEKYNHVDAHKLRNSNFAEFFCISLPKFIIEKALLDLGWEVTHKPIYLYNRNYRRANKKYQIMHLVSTYRRISNELESRLDRMLSSRYAQATTQIIEMGMTWVESLVKDTKVSEELKQDLKQIIDFRDRFR